MARRTTDLRSNVIALASTNKEVSTQATNNTKAIVEPRVVTRPSDADLQEFVYAQAAHGGRLTNLDVGVIITIVAAAFLFATHRAPQFSRLVRIVCRNRPSCLCLDAQKTDSRGTRVHGSYKRVNPRSRANRTPATRLHFVRCHTCVKPRAPCSLRPYDKRLCCAGLGYATANLASYSL